MLDIRRRGFDMVINLHGGPTSSFLTRVSGARWRAGFAHFRSATAYNLHIPTAQQILGRTGMVHTAEHVASALFSLGVPRREIPRAEVFASPNAVGEVQYKLAALGLRANQGYAVSHPAAAYATKQWKPSGFAEVSEYLQREFGLQTVFICGAGEADVLTSVQKHTGYRMISAVGWPLREVIALIAGSRIFVGNDSGPAHIAAAAGIPLLVIFGSSHSTVWRPWTDADAVVVQNDFDCNPCPGDRCYAFTEPRCILSITTEQVKVCLEGLLLHSTARR
jgi:ADP-heptose:LPS heptosyltransferase